MCHAPCRSFLFHLVFRIFIRQRNAHEAAVFAFAVPKARVSIAIQDCNRAVWLVANRVCIEPQRFQRFCVESLNPAIGQADQQDAVRISRAVDGKAGRTRHIARGFYCTGRLIYTVNVLTGIDNQAVVHKDGAADRAIIPSLAQWRSPVEHTVRRADRRFCVCNTVVAVRAAEI